MAYLLAIESATKVCSVALFQGDQLVAFKEQNTDYSHAENLAVFVNQLLKEQELQPNDLSAIVISKGPGSYTGLRIGTSLAKGMCYALKIPLISIETLEAMAWGFIQNRKEEDFLVCPMIDARRMEVYAAFYNAKLEIVKAVSADVIDADSYLNFLQNKPVFFLGDGSEKCKNIITHVNANFIENEFPSATKLGKLAFDKFENKQFENLAYFEPYYHKEFKAIRSKKLV